MAIAVIAMPSLACGGQSDEQEVKAAFSELRRAYLAEDYRDVCALMSVDTKREVGQLGHLQPTTCPADMARNMSAAVLSRRDRIPPRVGGVDVKGDAATVVAVLGGDTPGTVRFVKEDETWKLDHLFGTTAPPPPELR